MKKYLCRWPGCCRMVDTPHTYCEAHAKVGGQNDMRKAVAKQAQRPYAEARRPNEALYRTRQWTELSRKTREAHPFCYACGSSDGLTVHHIIPPKGDPALFFEQSNLIVVCKRCHDRITAQENA